MEKEYVNYEQSTKLKSIGMELPYYFGYYFLNNELVYTEPRRFIMDEIFIPAPLWQQVFIWFGCEHNLFIEPYGVWEDGIDIENSAPSFYIVDYFKYNESKCIATSERYETIFEAREACLLALINIVENKKGV